MLRIAVTGLAPDDVQTLGRRLHGALLECCATPAPEDPLWQSADAVAFLTADDRQTDLMQVALSAGKHVLAVTRTGFPVVQLDRLASLAREQNVLLAVENPDHALPSRRLIKQQIDNGKLGDVGLVRIHRGESPASSEQHPDGIPSALIGDLETAVWLVGQFPDAVYAVRRIVAQRPAPDGECLQVHLGFPGGGMALVTMTTAWTSADAHRSLSVIASTGAADADEHQNRQLLFGDGSVRAPLAEEGDATATLLQDFVAASRTPDGSGDRLQSWRRLGRLVAAVEESLATQQAVRLEDD